MDTNNSYDKYASSASEGDLVADNLKHIKRIAGHVKSSLPNSVEFDDLVQAGMVGLLLAQKRYDVEQGASFRTYSAIRIRGEMIDSIRKTDPAPRSVRRKNRDYLEMERSAEQSLGRKCSISEVAEFHDISHEELLKIVHNNYKMVTLSHDEMCDKNGASLRMSENEWLDDFEGKGLDPNSFRQDIASTIDFRHSLDAVENREMSECLLEGVETLKPRQQDVFRRYYSDNQTLTSIGKVLGVSESRVSQLIKEITCILIVHMRKKGFETALLPHEM